MIDWERAARQVIRPIRKSRCVGHGTAITWITVGPSDQPGTSIVLYPPAATPGVTDDERRIIAEMMAKGTHASINLATADFDGAFTRSSRSRRTSHTAFATAPVAILRAT